MLEKKLISRYNKEKRGNSSINKSKKELSIIGKICITFLIILVLLTIASRIIVSSNVKRANELESQNTAGQK